MTAVPSKILASISGVLVVLLSISAAEAGEVLRIKAIVTGQEGVGFNVGDRPTPVTIHLSSGRSRIDFNQRGAEAIYMVVDEETRRGWMIDAGNAQAMPMTSRGFSELLVDPEAPCENLGVRCRPIPARVIAGVRAQGWRYLDAGQRGPGGTTRGELWIDPARGLILGYEGYRSGRARVRRMQAMSVTVVEDASGLFDLPPTTDGAGAQRLRR